MKTTNRLLSLFAATTVVAVLALPGAALSTPDRYEGEWVQVTDDRPAHLRQAEGPTISEVLAAAHKPALTVQRAAARLARR